MSDSLRLSRPDHGDVPGEPGRRDLVGFTNRLSHQLRTGERGRLLGDEARRNEVDAGYAAGVLPMKPPPLLGGEGGLPSGVDHLGDRDHFETCGLGDCESGATDYRRWSATEGRAK